MPEHLTAKPAISETPPDTTKQPITLETHTYAANSLCTSYIPNPSNPIHHIRTTTLEPCATSEIPHPAHGTGLRSRPKDC